VYELQVDEVGPSLRSASAKVTKVARNGGQVAPDPSVANSDPWARKSDAYSDEPPF
jgi:single-strand DNA-binding protein